MGPSSRRRSPRGLIVRPGAETVPPLPGDVRQALAEAGTALAQSGVPRSTLEASILLSHVLRQGRAWLIAHPEVPLSSLEAACFMALVERRRRREPSAYLVGEKDWLDLRLAVNRNVLIPRPETELLAQEAIACLRLPPVAAGRAPFAVDVGTGSGALAIAMARACPRAGVAALDTSAGALRLAQANAQRHGAAGIEFLHGSLLSPLRQAPTLMVANLPYIAAAEMPLLEPELAFEPRAALEGGEDGLDLIRELVRQAAALLRPGAWLLLECGDGQASAVAECLCQAWPGVACRLLTDYAGINRVVRARVP